MAERTTWEYQGPNGNRPSPASRFGYVDAAMFVAAIGFFFLSRKFAEEVAPFPTAGILVPVCMAIAIGLFLAALSDVVIPARVLVYVFIATLALCAVFDYMAATQLGPLPSDEVGITNTATQLLVDGTNPYSADYRAANPAIAAKPTSWFTPTFSGQRVAEYAYPAGTVLALAPFVALFGTGWLTRLYLMGFLVSALIAWWVVPKQVRPILPAVVLLQTIAAVGGGSIDVVWLPFLIVAVWAWPRFVPRDTTRPWLRLAGPVALGIACSMKQNAWFVAPFLVTGVAMEAYLLGRRWLAVAASYLGIVAGVFVLVNVGFMVADLSAWLKTVAAPFTLHTVIAGDGIAAIPLSGTAGGDHLELLGIAAAVSGVGSLFVAALYYERCRRVLPLLAIIPLTLATRTLSSYLDFLIIPALVAATTLPELTSVRRVPRTLLRGARAGALTAAALCAVIIGVVLTRSSPLTLEVSATRISGGAWQSTTVSVVNRSSRTMTPSFFAAPEGAINYTLTRLAGPTALPPGSTAVYVLAPVPTDKGLGPGDQVRIVALGDLPESISQSDPFVIGGSAGGQ